MPPSGSPPHAHFGTRFGFLIWRRHLLDGEAPSFAAIGEQVGRTGPAVSAWRRYAEPPFGYEVGRKLAAFFEADEAWLVRGEGVAPDPDLFQRWEAARAPRPSGASSDSGAHGEAAASAPKGRRRLPGESTGRELRPASRARGAKGSRKKQ